MKRLEWHTIRLDDRVIAAGMGLRCGSSLVLPRIAFDEEFAAYGPGTLLTSEVVRRSFDRSELTEINHLSNADWHKAWNMSLEEYPTVYLVRRKAFAALSHYTAMTLQAAAGKTTFSKPAALLDPPT